MEPNTKERVLVVEDEAEIRELIALTLGRKGFETAQAGSVEEAKGMLSGSRIDLMVVDWMLPGESGVDFIRYLRANRLSFPILMVTAKSDSSQIVQALEAGADDYVVKPFHPSVLAARAEALLRIHRARTNPPKQGDGIETLTAGGIEVRVQAYEIKCCGAPVAVTAKEFKLLVSLIRKRGEVVTRDTLVTVIQGEGVNVISRTVDTHVFSLRKKLGPCGDAIESVRGIGYRIGGT
jgi:two-component system phosphate regulon response regulator PhoB